MQNPDCDEMRDLLDAAAEGALEPGVMAEVAAHLAGCAACGREMAAITGLRAELAALPHDAAPAHLSARIRASLPPPVPAPAGRRRVLELCAAGVAGLALGGGAVHWAARPDIAHDAFAAHGRALLAGLPLQVASSEQHTVRPWLSARLPWSMQVAQPDGFPLQGARLDMLGGQIVAALVYRRREHVVTVFAAAADAAPGWPPRAVARRGLHLLPWMAEGVRYLAVSDVAEAELRLLAAQMGG